uniref:PH01B019A14.5 protein n=1 Tax=Phyllostachys edulis TaxID=38705 RepID=L0P1M5_PHYED|nr:PH01B019A14.5 [Phyllostachys edulis]
MTSLSIVSTISYASSSHIGATHTAGVFSSPASFSHLVNVKLACDNYLLWKAQLLPFLGGQQLLGFVDGSRWAPAMMAMKTTDVGATQITNPEYIVWLQQDQMVLSTLLSSLSPEVLSQVLFLGSAAEVWMALERMFTPQSRARMIQIWRQLTTIQKKYLSIVDYFNKVKGLADALAAARRPLSKKESPSTCYVDLMQTTIN